MKRVIVMLLVGCVCSLTAVSAQAASATQRDAAAIDCPTTLKQLLTRLAKINKVLEGKTTYVHYSALMTSAKAAATRVPWLELEPDCLNHVGIHAEKAMDKYNAAGNVWRTCVRADDVCTNPHYDGPMQRLWGDAHRFLVKARHNLASWKAAPAASG